MRDGRQGSPATDYRLIEVRGRGNVRLFVLRESSDVRISAWDGMMVLMCSRNRQRRLESECQVIDLLFEYLESDYLECRDMWRMLSSKMVIETNERMSSTTNPDWLAGGRGEKKEGVVVVGTVRTRLIGTRFYWVRHGRDNKGRGDRGNCCDRNDKPSVCGDRYVVTGVCTV